jgi:hypothetical protein
MFGGGACSMTWITVLLELRCIPLPPGCSRSRASLGGCLAPFDLPIDLPTRERLMPEQRRNRMDASGEGRNRTGDTTVFSRVLYQLSYLARTAKCSGVSRRFLPARR